TTLMTGMSDVLGSGSVSAGPIPAAMGRRADAPHPRLAAVAAGSRYRAIRVRRLMLAGGGKSPAACAQADRKLQPLFLRGAGSAPQARARGERDARARAAALLFHDGGDRRSRPL